ncbi:MAG: hydantoinase/oxoprolinase family protein, partial [Firmicutes bacterium]|nr:hydantoinase/oxoprolinase family protein [Bacillota bacterium]
ERMKYSGEIITPLTDEEIDRVIGELKKVNAEAVAVMLLNAYINSENEEKIRKAIKEKLPDTFLTVSSDLSRQFREYERLCGTVLNSFVGPEVKKYMNNLKKTLEDIGIMNTYINHSNGGLMSIEESMQYPVKTALSGPAAGVVGAKYITDLAGETSIITVDVGGTSTDVSLVVAGSVEASDEKTISGYPVRIPSIDISTIGAGGGSIGWIDSGGILKVGPKSAGADPGPACYMRGGQEATITDARVVLGHLNNKTLLGGRLPIDSDLSYKAVQKLADKIGMDVMETAKGIVQVSNSNIIKEIKNVTVAKGYNPSDFCLVPFGGSGPLHAAELIEEMNIKKALVPKAPGLLAAYGLLTENMRRDFVQTRVMNLDAESMASFRAQFTALEKEAEKWYAQENIPMDKRGKEYFLDMRYQGQNHEIRVPVDIDAITDEKELRAAFIKTYERLYSFSSDDAVQIVNFGLSAIGNIILPLVNEEAYAGEDPSKAIIGSRRVYEGGGCFKDYTLYDRDLLGNGNIINGPAIVEQMDSTTVILANQYAVVDKYLNMIIERRPKGGDDNE